MSKHTVHRWTKRGSPLSELVGWAVKWSKSLLRKIEMETVESVYESLLLLRCQSRQKRNLFMSSLVQKMRNRNYSYISIRWSHETSVFDATTAVGTYYPNQIISYWWLRLSEVVLKQRRVRAFFRIRIHLQTVELKICFNSLMCLQKSLLHESWYFQLLSKRLV